MARPAPTCGVADVVSLTTLPMSAGIAHPIQHGLVLVFIIYLLEIIDRHARHRTPHHK